MVPDLPAGTRDLGSCVVSCRDRRSIGRPTVLHQEEPFSYFHSTCSINCWIPALTKFILRPLGDLMNHLRFLNWD